MKPLKVGDLVKARNTSPGVNRKNYPLLGIIIGFDKDGDPIVTSCKSRTTTPHWQNQIEVISEAPESR